MYAVAFVRLPDPAETAHRDDGYRRVIVDRDPGGMATRPDLAGPRRRPSEFELIFERARRRMRPGLSLIAS
jgi:hypothetical protein